MMSQERSQTRPEDSDATQAYWEFLRQRDASDGVGLEEFCAAHPDVANSLRALHAIYEEGSASVSGQVPRQPHRPATSASASAEFRDRRPVEDSEDPGGRALTFPADRYRVEDEVARGGMGVIYRVGDRELDRTLAMKVISGPGGQETPSSEAVPVEVLARFLQEAKVTAGLEHPAVVPVHQLGLDSHGRAYFTMRLVRGRDLAEVFALARRGEDGWNLSRAVGALVKVCQAVAYAHDKGVIHRDLKPSNVMTGGFGEVYVMDWGLAKVSGKADIHDIRLQPVAGTICAERADTEGHRSGQAGPPLLTMDGAVVGTPAYMSPEQATGRVGEVDATSDVYSLGAMLYTLLAGRAPYLPPGGTLSPLAVLGLVQQSPPQPLHEGAPDTPPELAAICAKAMARAKSDRYQTSLELAEDLQAWLDNRVVKAYRTGALAELRSWVTRNRGTAASAAAAILLLGAALVVSLTLYAREQEARRRATSALYDSLVNQAEAVRLARQPGWRRRSLNALSTAAALESPGKDLRTLRSDAVACLGGIDVDEVARLPARSCEVWSMDFSPEGDLLAAASCDLFPVVAESAALRLFETRTFGMTFELTASSFADEGRRPGHGYPAVRFAPNERRALFAFPAFGSRMLSLGDLEAGTFRVEPRLPLAGLRDNLQCFDFDRSGRWLAVGRSKGAELIDLASRRVELTVTTHEKRLRAGVTNPVALSPDARWLAVCGRRSDPVVRIIEAQSGKEVSTLGPLRGDVMDLSFSSDGRLAASLRDDTCLVWSFLSEHDEFRLQPLVLVGHTGDIRCVEFTSDGAFVASGSEDGSIRIWNAADGNLALELRPGLGRVQSLAFSRDGRYLAAASFQGVVYEISRSPQKRVLRGHRRPVYSLAFDARGERLASSGPDGEFVIWGVATGDLLRRTRIGEHRFPATIALSPDGERLAVAARNYANNLEPEDPSIYLYDLVAGARGPGVASTEPESAPKTLSLHEHRILSLDIDATGGRLVSAAAGGSVCVTSLAADGDAEVERRWDRLPGSVNAAFFVDSGRRILTAHSFEDGKRAGRIAVRDIDSGDIVSETRVPRLLSAAVNHARDRVAAHSSDGRVHTFLVPELTPLFSLELAHKGYVNAVAFGAGLLVTGGHDRRVEAWNAETGAHLLSFPALNTAVADIAFSPRGDRLAVSGLQGDILVWDLPAVRGFLAGLGLDWADGESVDSRSERGAVTDSR